MNKSDKQWIDDAVQLGCVVCRNLGYGPTPSEWHHIRSGVGKGQRSKHKDGLPLCPQHHRTGGHGVAFHAGPKVWQERYGTEYELLAQTQKDVEQLRKQIIGR